VLCIIYSALHLFINGCNNAEEKKRLPSFVFRVDVGTSRRSGDGVVVGQARRAAGPRPFWPGCLHNLRRRWSQTLRCLPLPGGGGGSEGGGGQANGAKRDVYTALGSVLGVYISASVKMMSEMPLFLGRLFVENRLLPAVLACETVAYLSKSFC